MYPNGIILFLSLCIIICLCQSKEDAGNYKVVCYLRTRANYRQGDGKFTTDDIDPSLCTHLIYAFAKLDNNRITPYDTYLDLKDDGELDGYARFNAHKKANPGLKTLIAIGGWNEGSVKYSQMAANPSARATFVQSVVDFCAKYAFDGLDVDWEYPANRGGAVADKQNFVTLLKELKEGLEPRGLLLTAAVAAGVGTVETAYDIAGISRYLDFINVMTYDFHGAYDSKTRHNAPLYKRPDDPTHEKVLNVDFAVKYWIDHGVPSNKLILGMATYGRTFTLADSSTTYLWASTSGPGRAGAFTQEGGMLGFNEICLNLKNGWRRVFIPKVEAPYAYSDDQWVGYDDEKSIGIKVDYLIENNLGGGMIWSLDTDDFRGNCGNGKFPLLTQISEKLRGKKVKPTHEPKPEPKPQPEQTTESKPEPRPEVTRKPYDTTAAPCRTTIQPNHIFRCTADGYFRDPKDCSVFYRCVKTGNYFQKFKYDCGSDMVFDENIKTCLPKSRIGECQK